ncbi:putative zinc-binding metallopeptidase [Algoriphagus sp. SE2]|uniref:zinc-binding metallopeptidase family protein n=1 Tax=Algoriphagus sp. SE2 TaxID=3141536 RepID=UPI0031CD27CA
MKIFECDNCGYPLYFENQSCEKCSHLSGYSDLHHGMKTFTSVNGNLKSDRDGEIFKYCRNSVSGVCNWIIPFKEEREYCLACSLNRIIPDLSIQENTEKWQKLENAKHRLVYQLQRLELPISPRSSDVNKGLCFDFVAKQGNPKVMTGHNNGIITIVLSEADTVHREYVKKQLSEPYRTLIGHFRHEVGHYYWSLLVSGNQTTLSEFREVFGDERTDYNQSLNNHYQFGATSNWQESYISQYATSHPWEDWAETWAHYLHIMDMTETSYFFGVEVNPNVKDQSFKGKVNFDPYEIMDFNKIYKEWAPISLVINSLNRSMGVPDMYPFVVSQNVIQKMNFIHNLLTQLKRE